MRQCVRGELIYTGKTRRENAILVLENDRIIENSETPARE